MDECDAQRIGSGAVILPELRRRYCLSPAALGEDIHVFLTRVCAIAKTVFNDIRFARMRKLRLPAPVERLPAGKAAFDQRLPALCSRQQPGCGANHMNTAVCGGHIRFSCFSTAD